MKLCDGKRIAELMAQGLLGLDAGDQDVAMLDDFRIGLRIQDEARALTATVDLSSTSAATNSFSLSRDGLAAGGWALGLSVERIGLGENLLGVLNTRSKYARFGFELMKSSWMVAPGFGREAPTNIVFEMTAQADTVGFNSVEPYGYLVIFELHKSFDVEANPYHERFPFRRS